MLHCAMMEPPRETMPVMRRAVWFTNLSRRAACTVT